VHFGFNGGDGLKFSDIVIAVASIVVLITLLEYPLGFVLDMQTGWGQLADGLISFLLSTLIVGVVFAGKIWEETRIKAILKIVVLYAILEIIGFWITTSASDYIAAIRESSSHPTYTATQWLYFDATMAGGTLFWDMILLLVAGFIGLYIGSLLRKPKKS